MMNIKFQIILIIALILVLLIIMNMVRKNVVDLKYVLSWILLDIAVLVIVIVPGLLDLISEIIGIYSVTNMVFFLGFCFLLIIVFLQTISLSRNSERIRKLSQELALRDKENKDRK